MDDLASLKRRIADLEARDCFVCHGKGRWLGNSSNDEPVAYHTKCPRCGTEATNDQ